MRYLVLLLLLCPYGAMAQQTSTTSTTIDQQIGIIVGPIITRSAMLAQENEQLKKQIEMLQKQLNPQKPEVKK